MRRAVTSVEIKTRVVDNNHKHYHIDVTSLFQLCTCHILKTLLWLISEYSLLLFCLPVPFLPHHDFLQQLNHFGMADGVFVASKIKIRVDAALRIYIELRSPALHSAAIFDLSYWAANSNWILYNYFNLAFSLFGLLYKTFFLRLRKFILCTFPNVTIYRVARYSLVKLCRIIDPLVKTNIQLY